MLDAIERELAELLPTLNLRPTLVRAAQVGRLLLRAKKEIPHGEFGPWLRSVGLRKSSAANYMGVARSPNVQGTGSISIEQFLQTIRRAKKGDGPRRESPEPLSLGTLSISGGEARAVSDRFGGVSTIDRCRKLLVCGSWDSAARDAAARGIAVLVLPEIGK